MNDTSPDTLLHRFSIHGDPAVAGALFDATAPGLFRLALALTPDAATAEDVLQSTFLVVLESAPRYDPSRPAWPWLVGILKVKAMEARRRLRRTPDPARLLPPAAPGNPPAEAASAEEAAEVHRALEELEEPYRSVALMRWRYGLTPAQIAHIRGQAPGTVSSLLSRALAKLRRRLTAVPLLLFGMRAPRGLEEIRGEFLRRAGAGTAGTAGAAGGILVGAKVLAAAAVLAVAAAAWWMQPFASPLPQPPYAPAVHDPAVDLLGRNAAAAPRPVAEEPLPPPVDLTACDRDLDLFGVVEDAAGRPVAGARLGAFIEPWKSLVYPDHPRYEEAETVASTRSAADGTFRLRLDRGRSVNLRAGAPGFAETVLPSCTAGERRTVTLHPGATLEVVLREEDGRPRAGWPIFLWRFEGPAFQRRGLSGPDGRCVFPNLTPGPAWISAGRPRRDGERPVVPASGIARLELVLVGGSPISGRVTDARSGVAIPGALVRPDGGVSPAAVADGEGRWTIPMWPETSPTPLVATARGYVSAVAGAGELREDSVDFALRRAAAVRGRAVDGAGTPVAGARVGVLGSKMENDASSGYSGRIQRSESSAAVTGPDGAFILDGLDPDLPHTIVVAADGLARTTKGLEAGAGDAGEVILVKGGRVEGVFLDPEGKPCPGAGVDLHPARAGGTGTEEGGYASHLDARTDDLGRFRWAGVAPGSYGVSFYGAAFPAVEIPVILAPGKDALDIVLRAESGESITVIVKNSRGTPDAGVLVIGDSLRLRASTDAEGRVRFSGLPPGKIALTVVREADSTGRTRAEGKVEPVVPAGQEVEIVLGERAPRGVTSGTVVGPSGAPEPRMLVQALDEGGKVWSGTMADEEGRFAVDLEVGRRFTLVVEGFRNRTRAEMKEMKARYGQVPTMPRTGLRGRFEGVTAPATGIAIRLHEAEKERSLTVKVVDADGRPVAGVKVLCQSTPGRQLATDAEGRVKFEGLEAAEVEVLVLADRPDALPADTVVPEPTKVLPEDREVILRCRAGIPVEGVVLAPDGTHRSGARLFISTTTGQTGMPLGEHPLTDDRGRFRLVGLPGVPQRVYASWFDEAGRGFSGEALVTPPSGDLEIRLAPLPR